jgi:hypothetical protein
MLAVIQDGTVCTYEIYPPEGVASGGIVTRERQLYYRYSVDDRN